MKTGLLLILSMFLFVSCAMYAGEKDGEIYLKGFRAKYAKKHADGSWELGTQKPLLSMPDIVREQ